MSNQRIYALESARAVLQVADDKLCFGHSEEDSDQASWLVTAAMILLDVAIEQRKASARSKGGAEQ